MTSQEYDLVCGFADDVVALDAEQMWQHYNLPASDAGKASLRLMAIRVAFVALGVTVC